MRVGLTAFFLAVATGTTVTFERNRDPSIGAERLVEHRPLPIDRSRWPKGCATRQSER